jgi:glutamate---cysteine ligase / carboxylate-amine ligase
VLWHRWPTAGPTQPFGSIANYRDTVERLIRGGVALDEAAICFDARASARYPTVEIRAGADMPALTAWACERTTA